MKRVISVLAISLASAACADGGDRPVSALSANRPDVDVVTTSGAIAAANLDYGIEAAERAYGERPSASRAADIVALRLVRARFFGRYSDFDRAEVLAEAHPEALALQVQVQSALHHFAEAAANLARLDPAPLADRAALAVATGAHAAVRDEIEAQADAQDDFRSHLLAGGALGALGDFDGADDRFVSALDAYRDVSPFPVAAARFQRGVMWAEVADDAEFGARMYTRALEALPGYVTATVHLAEIEWSNGDAAAAIARLQAVLPLTEDPEPFGLLGEILMEVGDVETAAAHIAECDRRYQGLLERHPEAFWDHASEFYSGPGARPAYALELAELNLANRATERAHLLVLNAALAAGDQGRACSLKAELSGRDLVTAELGAVLAETTCD